MFFRHGVILKLFIHVYLTVSLICDIFDSLNFDNMIIVIIKTPSFPFCFYFLWGMNPL